MSVTVRDGLAVDATDTFSWTVTNTNRAPAFDTDLGDRTSAEGAVISLDAGATDPDGDALTYAATGLPAGLSINTASGLISGTIGYAAAAASPYNVSVTVRDGLTVDATDTFSWTVTNTNRAPAFDQDLGDRTSAEGAVISLDAGATDPDGDALTYAATGLPAGLSINTASGLISGTIGYAAAAASPYRRERHRPRRPHRRRDRHVQLDGHQHGPGAGLRPRTWATGPAPRAPSSASTPGRPTPTATP